MSFDLLDRPLLYIPVKWPGLGVDDDGKAKPVEHSVEVQIELLDSDEANAWIDESSKEPEDVAARDAHSLASFKRVAKGWRGVKAGTRTADFSDDNIARMLRAPGFSYAFGTAYAEAMRGKVAIREGNSDGSPAPGPAGEPIGETSKAATSKN